MVFSIKDVAVVGGLAILAGVIIFGGRQLFGALSSIKLPEFPDINLPDFNFGGLFEGFNPFPNANLDDQGNVIPMELTQPGEGGLNPADMPTNPTPLDIILNPGPGIAPGQAPPSGDDILLSMFNPPGVFGFGILGSAMQGISTQLAQALGISSITQGQISLQQISSLSSIGLDVSQLGMLPSAFNFGLFSAGQPQTQMQPTEVTQGQISPSDFPGSVQEVTQGQITPGQIQSQLDTGQQFFGGGPSFMGGSINITPLENLSLNQIIEQEMVTASQAANLLAIAQGFNQGELAFLNQGMVDVGGFVAGGPPATSAGFEGLTPEEIALQLTGGNISNF